MFDASDAATTAAMFDARTREASLITFLTAAADITLLGIGGAFGGLVPGLAAHAVLNGRMPPPVRYVHRS